MDRKSPNYLQHSEIALFGFPVAAVDIDLMSALTPTPHWWSGVGNPVVPAVLDEGLGWSLEVLPSQLISRAASPVAAAMWMPYLLCDPALPSQGPSGWIAWL